MLTYKTEEHNKPCNYKQVLLLQKKKKTTLPSREGDIFGTKQEKNCDLFASCHFTLTPVIHFPFLRGVALVISSSRETLHTNSHSCCLLTYFCVCLIERLRIGLQPHKFCVRKVCMYKRCIK